MQLQHDSIFFEQLIQAIITLILDILIGVDPSFQECNFQGYITFCIHLLFKQSYFLGGKLCDASVLHMY